MNNSEELQKTIEIEDQDLYTAYFGKDAEYYLERLEKIKNGATFLMNPYAFFLGILWFAYRKMFDVVLLFLAIIAIEITIQEIFFTYSDTTAYDRLMNLVYALILGGFANYWYMRTAKKKIEKAKSIYSRREDMIAYLEQKGGTNLGYSFAVLGAFIAFIVFLVLYLD